MPVPDITLVDAASEKPRGLPLPETWQEPANIVHLVNNISALKAPRPVLRMLAFAIDFALLYGFSIGTAQWLSVLMLRSLMNKGSLVSAQYFDLVFGYATNLICPMALLFFAFAYYVTSAHVWGASLGQGLCGLRVVTRTGELPSIERAGRRFFASIFSLLSFGFFFFFGAYGRDGICFHDEASDTRVVLRDSWRRSLWSSTRGVEAAAVGEVLQVTQRFASKSPDASGADQNSDSREAA